MNSTREGGVASSVLYIFALTVLGFALGGVIGGRILGSGTGFDRLADTLGGVMIGTVAAGIVGLATVKRRTGRQLLTFSLAAFGAAALVILAAQLVPMTPAVVEAPAPSGEVSVEFEPAFLLTVDSTPEDGATPKPSTLLPWRIATVRSLDRSLVTVGWGDRPQQCGARIDDAMLMRVVTALNTIGDPAPCEPCDGCVSYVVNWSLAPDKSGDLLVTDRCLAVPGAFGGLGDVLASVYRDSEPQRQCVELTLR